MIEISTEIDENDESDRYYDEYCENEYEEGYSKYLDNLEQKEMKMNRKKRKNLTHSIKKSLNNHHSLNLLLKINSSN